MRRRTRSTASPAATPSTAAHPGRGRRPLGRLLALTGCLAVVMGPAFAHTTSPAPGPVEASSAEDGAGVVTTASAADPVDPAGREQAAGDADGAPATSPQGPGDLAASAVELPAVSMDCLGGFTLTEAAGCLRPHGDGLADVQLLDGSTVTVATPHAHDTDDHDTDDEGSRRDGAERAEGSSSRSRLDTPRRSVSCAARRTHRTVVLYAHAPGQSRMGPAVRGQIREVIERSNGLVARAARGSGGPAADLRVACTRGGYVSIPSIETRGASFAELQDAARRAGFDRDREKYLIFADVASPDGNVAGMAQLHRDDRRVLTNRNNHGGAMYGVVWAGHFAGRTPLHELSHLMGAVQPSAPGSDDSFHCTDSRDILCASSVDRGCASYELDCGTDSYFSTSPRRGSYLATHWNLGWAGNRFIDVVGRPTPNVTPEADLEVTCSTLTCELDARDSSDDDGFIERVAWRFGDGQRARGWRPSHSYADPGTYTVTVTVVDDRGERATATREVTVDNQRPTARITADCGDHTCRYDGTGSSDPDGEVAAWRWEVEGQRRTGPILEVTWPEDGTYTVALTALDNDGRASERTTETVTVCGPTTVVGEVVCDAGGVVDRATGGDDGTTALEPVREVAGSG